MSADTTPMDGFWAPQAKCSGSFRRPGAFPPAPDAADDAVVRDAARTMLLLRLRPPLPLNRLFEPRLERRP